MAYFIHKRPPHKLNPTFSIIYPPEFQGSTSFALLHASALTALSMPPFLPPRQPSCSLQHYWMTGNHTPQTSSFHYTALASGFVCCSCRFNVLAFYPPYHILDHPFWTSPQQSCYWLSGRISQSEFALNVGMLILVLLGSITSPILLNDDYQRTMEYGQSTLHDLALCWVFLMIQIHGPTNPPLLWKWPSRDPNCTPLSRCTSLPVVVRCCCIVVSFLKWIPACEWPQQGVQGRQWLQDWTL